MESAPLAPKRRFRALLPLGTLLIWAVLLTVPYFPASIDLDPSWQHAYAHFFAHRLQAGVDYAYTYGPWGFLEYGAYHPELFVLRVALWEGAAKLGMAAALAWALSRMRGWADRAAFCALLLFSTDWEARFFAIGLCLAVVLLAPRRLPSSALLGACALLALLALLKFTLFVLFVLVLACALLGRGLEHGWREGARVLAAGAASLLAAWLAAGQEPGNLATFLRSSWEIASGYATAMSWPAAPERGGRALLLLASSAVWALVAFLTRPRSFTGAGLALAYLGTCGLAYKATLVRHADGDNFFLLASLAPFLLLPSAAQAAAPRAGGAMRPLGAVLRFGLVLLALPLLGGVVPTRPDAAAARVRERIAAVAGTVRSYARLGRQRADLERQRAEAMRWFRMPHTRAAVGAGTVDVVPNEAGAALLNGLAWRPRPVFQGFSAYTRSLIERNARFLESAGGPEHVLLRPQTIDERFAPSEDPLVLQALLRGFEPLLNEQEFLLLRRRPAPPPPTPAREVLVDRVLEPDTELDLEPLGGRGLLLELDLRPGPGARLRSLLYQAQPLAIEFRTRGGEWRAARVVPDAMRAGVLVRPYLAGTDDWIGMYAGEDVAGVDALRVPRRTRRLLGAPVGVRVLRADDLLPPPWPRARERLAPRWFACGPADKEGPFPLVAHMEASWRAVIVHPPAVLRFDAPPGAHGIHGRFGIAREAHAETDGALLRVGVETREGTREVLYERALDPRSVAGDREPQELALRVVVPEGGRIFLSTDPGPAGDALRDWVWLADLQILPVEQWLERLRIRPAPR